MDQNNIFYLPEIIKLLEDISSKDSDIFFKEILELAIKIIPEADYGSLIMFYPQKNIMLYLSVIGHNENILLNQSFYYENMNFKDEVTLINDNIVEHNKNYISKSYKIIKKASLPIKQTLLYQSQISKTSWIQFSLDISENNNNNNNFFSDNSKEILKLFGNIAKIFIINKLKDEKMKSIISELKMKNYEYELLNENNINTIIDFLNYKAFERADNFIKILKIFINNIPFTDKAILGTKENNRIIIIDNIGYDLMINKLTIKSIKEDIVTFEELSGEFFELTFKIKNDIMIFIKINDRNIKYLKYLNIG
ncbi:hypothetical protein JCM30566_08680 [Marinitoga arctica]